MAAIERAAGREPDVIIGKPSITIVEEAVVSVGLPAADCLFVGDNIETDILAAHAVGMAALLVWSGVSTPADLAASGVQVAHVADTVMALADAFPGRYAWKPGRSARYPPGYERIPDPTSRRFTLAQARDQLSAIVRDVDAHGPVELTENGEPVAVIVSPDEYRRRFAAERDTWAAYERFRAEADLSEIDGSEFEGVRDRSPGRDVTL